MNGRMRSAWRGLDSRTRLVIAVALGFVAFRGWLAAQSGFGFHQGWNEGHYALIAHGLLDHPLVPKYGNHYVYNVPPLFPYFVSIAFALLGESVFAARLPSVLAAGATIIATYWLGMLVYGDRHVAALGAAVLAVLPYYQLYGGRAQTDVLLLAFVTASLACLVYGYTSERRSVGWLAAGGVLFVAGFAAKQPAIIVPAVVVGWLASNHRFDRETLVRTGIVIASAIVAALPLLAWFFVNFQTAPDVFFATWEQELFSRTRPFANLPLLLVVAFGLGVTPPVLGLAGLELAAGARGLLDDGRDNYRGTEKRPRRWTGPTVLTWWVVLYGLFVFYRTPKGHQYYAVVLTVPLALLAARGVFRVSDWLADAGVGTREGAVAVLVFVSLLGAVAGTGVLFELSGEFSAANGGGERVAADVGTYLNSAALENATVLVVSGYRPSVQWYARSSVRVENVKSFRAGQLTPADLEAIREDASGSVYVVSASPSWTEQPVSGMQPAFTSNPYEFTVMNALNQFINVDSKFQFYLEDRRLVVYRLDDDAPETRDSHVDKSYQRIPCSIGLRKDL